VSKPIRFQRFRRLTLFGWRHFWRCIAGNNKIVIPGGDPYHNKDDMDDTINMLIEKIKNNDYVIEDV
jgi:hypothetical protein